MARTFNGSSDFEYIATPLVTAPPLTLAAWVKTTSNGAGSPIATEGLYPGGWANGWFLFVNNYAVWAYTAAGVDHTGNYAVATASLSSGVWGHIAGVFASATDRRAFLNGANKGTDTVSRVADPTYVTRTRIGCRAANDPGNEIQFFNGQIAECAAWNVALTDDEVAILGKGFSPLLVRPQSIIGYWPIIGRSSAENSLKSGFSMAITGTTVADHPRIIYPGR